MNVIFMSKNFKKVSFDERKAVEKSVKKLLDKIEQYEHDGIPFEHIYNDDSVKYDAFANGYYTYKAQTQRFPLRILYTYMRVYVYTQKICLHRMKTDYTLYDIHIYTFILIL